MAGKIPEHFALLHQGEELVRAESIKAIEASDLLSLHADMIERASDLIHYFIHKDDPANQNDLIIRLLGIRLFNGLNATLNLLLSGYYQQAAADIREVVETFFLLDYFNLDRSKISEWEMADDETRWKLFKPGVVRAALDSRDKYTGKKRGELYSLLSTLASHPNPKGFQLFKLPDGNHHCGPFFDLAKLDGTLSELGKAAIQAAAIFGVFFDPEIKSDYEYKLGFMVGQNEWFKKFYGNSLIESAELESIKEKIEQLSLWERNI